MRKKKSVMSQEQYIYIYIYIYIPTQSVYDVFPSFWDWKWVASENLLDVLDATVYIYTVASKTWR